MAKIGEYLVVDPRSGEEVQRYMDECMHARRFCRLTLLAVNESPMKAEVVSFPMVEGMQAQDGRWRLIGENVLDRSAIVIRTDPDPEQPAWASIVEAN